jgi:hypothetical protein
MMRLSIEFTTVVTIDFTENLKYITPYLVETSLVAMVVYSSLTLN